MSSHQPQLPIAVQVPQLASPAEHGSGGAQPLEYHSQSEHEPALGPLLVPVAQVPVDEHQPHADIAVHELQLAAAAHGSGGAHSLAYQRQSPHEPAVGPLEPPV